MDKEKIITVLIGLLVGAGLASAYFLSGKFLPQLTQNAKTITFSPKQNSTASVSGIQTQKSLVIMSPDNNIATSAGTINVSGQGPSGARVTLFANADEKIASADAQGNFNADLKLEDGANEISVSAPDGNGKLVTVQRSVVLLISP